MEKLDELIEEKGFDLHWKHIEPKLCALLSVVAGHVGLYDESGQSVYPHDCFCTKKGIDKKNIRINSTYLNFLITAVNKVIEKELK